MFRTKRQKELDEVIEKVLGEVRYLRRHGVETCIEDGRYPSIVNNNERIIHEQSVKIEKIQALLNEVIDHVYAEKKK